MKYLLLVIILFSASLYSQDLEKIEQSEVLFVLHNGINGNYQSKRVLQKFKKQRTSLFYDFFVVNKNEPLLQNVEITFTYNHYYDFDERDKENPVPYFMINKSFLRKNKDIIVTGELMQEIGYLESVKLINKAKTIFLIDKSEIQNKELIVKEVRYFYIVEE